MSCLVHGDGVALFLGHYLRALLKTANDAVDGVVEILLLHCHLVVASSDEGSLVAHVGDVGTRETRCLARQHVEVDAAVGLHATQVHLENLLAVVELWQVHIDLAVEAAGTQQRLVEDVDAVGGSQDYDSAVGAKAVHLGEQLVEGALTLVVAAHAGVLATGTSHGVDLVDEDDAWSLVLGLLEQVANARGSHAHKHLHEVATRQREEWHVGLASHSLGEQCLAGSRRSHEQSALGNFSSQIGVSLWILEEVNNLGNLGLGLGKTCHVGKGHLGLVVLVKELRLRLAHAEDASTRATASHAPRHPEPEDDEQDDGSKAPNPAADVAGGLIAHVALERPVGVPLLDVVVKFLARGDVGGDVGARMLRGRKAVLEDHLGEGVVDIGVGLLLVAEHDDAVDSTFFHVALELRPAHVAARAHVVAPVDAQDYRHDNHIHPQDAELGLLAA